MDKKEKRGIKYSTPTVLRFKYKNWEGEVAIRSVRPIKIWCGKTEFHKGTRWFLKAFDIDKKAERDFAMDDIIEIYPIKE